MDVAALAARAGAGVSAAASASAAGERVAVLIDAAVPTRSDADVTAAGRVYTTVKDLAMRASVAGDGRSRSAFSACGHWVRVAIAVGAARAPGRSASVPAARASRAALEFVVMIVCATDRVCRHTRMPATLHVNWAVRSVAVVRARL